MTTKDDSGVTEAMRALPTFVPAELGQQHMDLRYAECVRLQDVLDAAQDLDAERARRGEAAGDLLNFALEAGDVIADWCNVAGDALRNLMGAYERRIRSLCSSTEEIAKEPWRCAEYIEAERALASKPCPMNIGSKVVDDATTPKAESNEPVLTVTKTKLNDGDEPVALTFDAFRAANLARCVKWHPAGIESWSPSDWLTAVTGELGELASLLKMRNRERDGLPGNKFSPTDKQVADELADVLTYLDLLAAALGVNLGRAAVEKFNEISERVGFPDRITLAEPPRNRPEFREVTLEDASRICGLYHGATARPDAQVMFAALQSIRAHVPCDPQSATGEG